MVSRHLFKLGKITPDEQTAGGMRFKASQSNFPLLSGMSFYKLILHPNGLREPHWHANADELGYCLQGQALVSLYHTGDTKATFLVQAGDVFFIPSGALHTIENVDQKATECLLCFSHEETEDFNLSTTLNAFSNAVLGNTWSQSSQLFHALPRSAKTVFAALRPSPPIIPEDAYYITPYRYHLEAAKPLLINDYGSARMARQNVWPILQRQALYSLRLTGQGMREPHWHPETAELGYVNKGAGRMSILNSEGNIDTYFMEAGDIYFIPKAYPHHIENLQDDDLHLLIFFDQAMPRDIGFTGSIRANSNELLAAVTQVKPAFFEQLPKYYADLFIVNKFNPLDP